MLQLPASVGDLTTDIDFESSLNAQSGTLSVTSFEIPQDLSAGDTIELTFTVNDNTAPGGTPATVTLTADFDPDATGQTLDAFARAVAEQVSNAQHPDTSLADRALGLSADIVTLTADPASGAAGAAGALGIQISAPQGANLGAVQLSLSEEVTVNEGTVTQQISEARVAIPSQAELDDIDPQGGDLRVDLFVDNVQVLDTTFRVDQGRTPQQVAERLRDHIEGQLTGAPTGGASIPEDLRDALQDLSLIHI